MTRNELSAMITSHGLVRSIWHHPPGKDQKRRLDVEFVDGHVEEIPLQEDGSDLREVSNMIVSASNLPKGLTDKVRNRSLDTDFLLYKNPHLVDINDDFSIPL